MRSMSLAGMDRRLPFLSLAAVVGSLALSWDSVRLATCSPNVVN
jgi:hypothetical protein